MGRSLLVGTLLLVGCTRLNPAFDPYASDSDEAVSDGDASSDLGDATETATSDGTDQGESASASESSDTDLPLACEHEPRDGLILKFGDPRVLGTCPLAIDIWARVVQSGDTWIVENCSDGCETCLASYPLSAHPLDLIGHVPGEQGKCLRIQASVPLDQEPNACFWGALSIFDGFDATPYVIAIANGSEPTSLGVQALAGLIPDPVKVGSCNCDDVGQSNDCCYEAPEPPEFLGFPWNGDVLLPGESAEITIANPSILTHLFEVFQAQRLYACENPEATVSWAVYAKLR